MTEPSYSVELQSLTNFAQELQTQLQSITAPMQTLAASASGAQPQFGGFTEASNLAASQRTAVAQMQELLGQVQKAIGFAENVTNTVADGYQDADQSAAAAIAGAASHPPQGG